MEEDPWMAPPSRNNPAQWTEGYNSELPPSLHTIPEMRPVPNNASIGDAWNDRY